ncbi:HTTM domain-containing protein [Streptomyces sp. BI20]|uniref:HTTM domain-containing protein n=1 Tax=Streptomyces sp. BI20 TaxID=3403460 RepID=UPI003C76EDFD
MTPPAPSAPPGRTARLRARLLPAVDAVTGRVLGPYQSAVVRIGFAGTWLLFLLRELPHRRELYGPDSPWGWDLAERLVAGNRAFTVLLWTDAGWWFELVYLLAALAALATALGWHTRFATPLFLIGVLSLQNRSVFMGDGGDNVVHIMAIYLVLTRCASVWSLDARRAARRAAAGPDAPPDRVGPALWALSGAGLVGTVVADAPISAGWFLFLTGLWVVQGLWWAADRAARRAGVVRVGEGRPGEGRALLDVLGTIAHNGALFVIMVEVCLIYATAGWYKIQGSRWQDGTALYYPLGLDYFTPWPGLSALLASSGTAVLLITYGTVLVQVAFPFTLFHRRIKNVLLAVMMLEHLGIAVLLGLPVFSLAMIAADAVFLPTSLLLRVGAAAGRARGRIRDRLRSRGPPPRRVTG